MTANELADKLQNDKANTLLYVATVVDSANMLRQQAKEIEALKKEAALQRLSDFTQEAESFDRTASHMAGKRELTDEEIRTVIDEHWEKTSNVNLFDFARAILKKASEK